jgi:hypothetical protein
MAKAINSIKNLPTGNLPVDYKNRLDDFKADIDIKAKGKKAIFKRRAMEKFVRDQVAKGETITIPEKHLKNIGKKSVSEMSILELEAVANQMRQIAHVGATKSRLLKTREAKELAAWVDEAVASGDKLKGGRAGVTVKPFPKTTLGTKINDRIKTIKSVGRKFAFRDARMERKLELLDSMKSRSINWKKFYGEVNASTDEYYRGKFEKDAAISRLTEKHGLDVANSKTSQRLVSEDVGYLTGAQIMGVYSSLGDADKMAKIKDSWGFSDKNISDIVNKITPQEKAYIDEERMLIWDAGHGEINPFFEALSGQSLPRKPGYSHIVSDMRDKAHTITEEDIMERVWGVEPFIRPSGKPGIIKERKTGARPRVVLDHWQTVSSYIDQAERFKAFSLAARDLRKILSNKKYKAFLDDKMGKEFYPELVDWTTSAVTGKLNHGNSPAEFIVKKMRHNATTYLLGWVFTSPMKAAGSLINAMGHEGSSAGTILGGMYNTMRNYKDVRAKAFEMNPQLKARAGGERELKAMMEDAQKKGLFTGKRLSPLALEAYKIVDEYAVLSTWSGKFNRYLRENPDATDKEAAEAAIQLVVRSQPAPEIKDLPRFFRGGEVEKQFTWLRNQVNQNQQTFNHDIFGKLKHGAISKTEAMRRFLWLSMVGLAIGTVTRGRFKRSLGEAAADLVSPYATGTFMLGNIINSILNEWQIDVPMLLGLKEIFKAFTTKQPVKHGARAVGIGLGIPIKGPLRTGEGALDLATGETDDIRRLIWSKYVIEGGQRGGRRLGPVPRPTQPSQP